MKKLVFFILVIIGFIVLDQVTKIYVRENFYLGESIPVIHQFFNLTFVTNKGAAFGMLANAEDPIRHFLFLFLPVLVCLWLCWIIYNSQKQHWLQGFAYSLILSGAIGNLIDRFLLGYVVDFFDFYHKAYHFPAFNIADSCITVGASILLLEGIFLAYGSKKAKSENDKSSIKSE